MRELMGDLRSNTGESGAGSITSLYQKLKAGHSDSARELWNRFFPRLLQVARRTLAGRELPVGAEDAVQVAFFQFFQRIEAGQVYGDPHRYELWKLLSIMTAQIASKQVRHEQAQKRGQGRTISESDLVDDATDTVKLDELLSTDAPPECEAICVDLLNLLPADLREVAVLRLAGYTHAEIKQITGFPIRSIERRVQIIRSSWLTHVRQA